MLTVGGASVLSVDRKPRLSRVRHHALSLNVIMPTYIYIAVSTMTRYRHAGGSAGLTPLENPDSQKRAKINLLGGQDHKIIVYMNICCYKSRF